MSMSNQQAQDEIVTLGKWSTDLKAVQAQLKQTRLRLEQYQAALRLANIEIKRRNRGIIGLTTFAYQASQAANANSLLKLTLIHGMQTTDAQTGAVVLVDHATKELTLKIHQGLSPDLTRILTGQQVGRGATALMPHLVAGLGALLEQESTTDEAEKELLQAGELTTLASLPLQFGNRVLGALVIGLKEERSLTSAELFFLMALSQEAAIALEGLRLREGLWRTAETFLGGPAIELEAVQPPNDDFSLDVATPFALPAATATMVPQANDGDLEQLLAAMAETEKEVRQQNSDLQTLNIIAEMMNRTLNLKEILQQAVNQTRAVLETEAACIYLLDENNRLELGAANGFSKAYTRAMQRPNLNDGLEGQVVSQQKAYFIESIIQKGDKHKIWVDKEGIQGLAAVPITRPDIQADPQQVSSRVIGVLMAATTTSGPRAWSAREMRLLESIANHVALAIDNARLYEKLQENEAGLRAGNQVLQEINNMLSAENALFTEFMQGHLEPGLKQGAQLLAQLWPDETSPLGEAQRQTVIALQKIMSDFAEMSQWVIRNT
jgi:GAF domain-containing protein